MPANGAVYPALDNGMIAQTPVYLSIRRKVSERVFGGGARIQDSANAYRHYLWRLQYEHLSESEWSRFVEFIETSGRGAKTFVFPDPVGNLLRNSQNLTAAAWQKSAGLGVGPIEYVPGRPCWILTNPTPIVQTIEQLIGIHDQYAMCFSIWAGWTSAQEFKLTVGNGPAIQEAVHSAGPWQRYAVRRGAGPGTNLVRARIEVKPFSQLIVSSPQLEIGYGPQGYLATGEASGVFAEARLAEKPVDQYSTGANRRGLVVEIQGVQRI